MKKEIRFNFTNIAATDNTSAFTSSIVLQKASLYSQFSIEEIKMSPGSIFSWTEDEEKLLKKYSYPPNKDGKYSIKDYERNLILKSLGAPRLRSMIDQLPFNQKDDNIQSMFIKYVTTQALPLDQQNLEELVATYSVSRWLRNTGIEVPNEDDILTRIKQEGVLKPFKVLTQNFKGRIQELVTLSDYVDWRPKSTVIKSITGWFRDIVKWHEKPPLIITGIGGVGKSTLVSKFILDQLSYKDKKKLPFIYFDFDKPGLSVSNPIELAIEALRQLSIQFPSSQSIFNQVRYQLQEEYLEKEQKTNISFATQSRGSDREVFYKKYTEQFREQIAGINSPVLVVFDSFEEIQYRASYSELHNVFNFIREISNFIPRLRPVFVGRSEINYTGVTFEKLNLEGFDRASAIACLQSKGIEDETFCAAIYKKLGGNPLTLQMIADLVKKGNISSITGLDSVADDVDQALQQEQLVKRNLEHVHNAKVAKIAIPGILVRKISPKVIQYILAGPCGFPDMTKTEATEIFGELKKESFLITETASGISFRQDLRISLAGLIMKKEEYHGMAIHDGAIEFYKGKADPESKAEYLYHRLMRGDDPSTIENIYDDSVRPYIENSLAELSTNAYLYLSSLMGITASADKVKDASLLQWEEYQKTEIIDVLQKGDENSLLRISKILDSRPDRSFNSCLYYFEAKVCLKLANYKKTAAIIDKALQETAPDNNKQRLDLVLLKTDMYEYQLDFSNAFTSISAAPLLQVAYDYLLKDDFKNVQSIIDGRLTWSRLGKRNGEETFQIVINTIYKFIEPFEDRIYDVLRKMMETLNLSGFLPFPYKTYVERLYSQLHNINFKSLFAEMDKAFSNQANFMDRYKKLKLQIKDKSDLERMLESKYNLNLKDICEPGVLEINLVDVLKFMEMADQRIEDFNAQ